VSGSSEVLQRKHFGMRLTSAPMTAAPDDLAALNDDRANTRVR
jgi:hypothetical protein